MTIAIPNFEAPSIPQGQAQRWDRDTIDTLATVTIADVSAAVLLWDSLAPKGFRGLLGAIPFEAVRDSGTFTGDATDSTKDWKPGQWKDFAVTVGKRRQPITGNTATTLAFADTADTAGHAYRIGRLLPLVWFDVSSQRYGLGDRGFITDAALFAAAETFRETAQQQAASAVATVYGGGVDVETWQAETAVFLKRLELATVAIGAGGIGRLGAEDLNTATSDLRFHLGRLSRFAREIEFSALSAEAAARRASLYPQSIVTGGFDDARRRSAIASGFDQEINVLSDAEHCQTTAATPGCADLTELGWVDIGTLPPPGLRTCSFMCKCHLSFRRESEQN